MRVVLENETLNLLEMNLKITREPSETGASDCTKARAQETVSHLDRTSGLFVR